MRIAIAESLLVSFSLVSYSICDSTADVSIYLYLPLHLQTRYKPAFCTTTRETERGRATTNKCVQHPFSISFKFQSQIE